MIRPRFRTMPARCPQPCDLVDRVEFWRNLAERAQADADRMAVQLQKLGVRPAPLVDGERTDGWGS